MLYVINHYLYHARSLYPQHITFFVDYLTVEPRGIGRLLDAGDDARRGGLDAAVLDGLDVAVNVLHQQQLVELAPGGHHLCGELVAEVGQFLLRGIRFQPIHATNEVILIGLLYTLHVDNHGVVAKVAEVGDAVEEPEGGGLAVLAHGAVALAETEGDAVDGAEHGAVAGGVGVVDAEPEYAAHPVGQPAAALGHEAEARLLGADGALVDVALAVDLEVHRAPAVGAVEGTGAHVVSHIHRRAFEVVAHEGHAVLHAELAVGLDPQGQALGDGIAHGECLVALHAVGTAIEHGIDAGFAGAETGEGEGVVGVGEGEVGIAAAVESLLAGEGGHIIAVDALHRGVEDTVDVLRTNAF